MSTRNVVFVLFVALFISGSFAVFTKPALASSTDGTIDSTYKYAWGENIGWVNFGTSNGNIHVTDSALSGHALSETTGWIYLNDITNDGEGNLSGYGWGENTGFIKFNPTNGGVSINSSGEFTGSALGENIGWIIFGGDYKVKTDWRPRSARPACNNSSDDDGDGKTDYPNDTGCSSLEDTDETDAVAAPSGGGGGMPTEAYNSPASPSGGFSVFIQDNAQYTNSRAVILKLNGGPDAQRMAISNSADFYAAQQEPYQTAKTWTLTENDGLKTVYVRFYTQYGQSSQVVSDTIVFDTTAPEIKITTIKDYYSSAEDVSFMAETEAGAEIILGWDKNYGLIHADEQGGLTINLGKMSSGSHQLSVMPTDLAGNKGNAFMVDLTIKPTTEVFKPAPVVTPKKTIIEKLQPFIPEFLKPKQEEEKKPEEMIVIPKEIPIVMRGRWELMPEKPIREFVLAPLPKGIRNLAQKFPKLEKTLEEVGVGKMTDVAKLKSVKLTLPGLTERVGWPTANVETGQFALPRGVPVAKLSPAVKQRLPTEIVFAKSGGELVDFNIALSISDKGEPQQKIQTISGKPLQLMVKPDKPVKSVKGYLVFTSKLRQPTSLEFPLNSLLTSVIFGHPVFAKTQDQPVRVEEKLVLLEFEYTDPDGDGIYTAEIQAPLIEGEYEIITVMDFDDPELGKREIRLTTVVDPEGYIYERDGDKETRIPGAIASLYWLNPKTKQYEMWPAKEYQQENPQTTDVRGTYSFLVPEGYYYLQVETPGYLVYEGKPFQVKEGSGVHTNIELKSKYWWLKIVDWKTILLAVVIILLLYNFYRDKMREQPVRSKNL
jgi:hypothetical protein